jgi:hypothetical protein
MRNAEARHVLLPKRREVNGQADFAAAAHNRRATSERVEVKQSHRQNHWLQHAPVHLGRLALELRDAQLRVRDRVRRRNLHCRATDRSVRREESISLQ